MALEVTPDGFVIDDGNSGEPGTGMELLDDLLKTLPGFETITPLMKQSALDGAVIPDSAGVWPGKPSYVTTYDVYYAAVTLIGFLKAQPVVRQVSSEGTSAALDAPQWGAVYQHFTSLSPILGMQSGIIREVPIPGGSHVRRTDMSGVNDDYGDVDTDLG